jgi:hypothetical protein
MSRLISLTVLVALLSLFVSAESRAAEHKFRCGECHRVETFSNSDSHYCEGEKGHKHARRLMDRIDARERTFKYKCGECGKIEESTKNETMYCYGTSDRRHGKRQMTRTDQ